MYEYYDKRVYELDGHDPDDYNKALSKIREWDYNSDSPIALGAFYKKERPVFEYAFKDKKIDTDAKIKELLNDRA
jgi:2-oxoglutarate ferredoxin oxidoreductase subunit beta